MGGGDNYCTAWYLSGHKKRSEFKIVSLSMMFFTVQSRALELCKTKSRQLDVLPLIVPTVSVDLRFNCTHYII